jgi:hypothetical protein
MHNTGQTVTIRHKEYLGEIRGSTAFTVQQSYQINPGNSLTFPWLSGVAVRFQEYRIKGMVFHYIPTSGTAVSSTDAALGSVMMQTSYRSNDMVPSSKVELLNEYCSSESVPCEAFAHPIECDPKENPFNVQYVRSGNIPSNDSQLLYDLGVTHIATSGQQIDGKVIGDLWVTYEIELKKPIVASNVTAVVDSYAAEYTGGITTGAWFTGSTSKLSYGSLAITTSGQTITFPKGTVGAFVIMVRIAASTSFTACDLSGAPTFVNCAQYFWAPASTYARNVVAGTAPTVGSIFYVAGVILRDPAVQATVTLPAGSWTGSAAYTNLSITSQHTDF